MAYPQKTITGEEAEFLLNLKETDIGEQFFIQNLSMQSDYNGSNKSNFKILPPRFNVYDKITIPKGRYCDNKEPINTHVGILIFNKFFFEKELNDVIPYMNQTVSGGDIGAVEDKLSNALLNDKITAKQMVTYLNKIQWMFTVVDKITGSITPKTVKPLDSVRKAKERLLKENKDAIAKGDPVVSSKIEKELLNIAKEELKGDPGMDLYDAGSNASFGNNYKAMMVKLLPTISVMV